GPVSASARVPPAAAASLSLDAPAAAVAGQPFTPGPTTASSSHSRPSRPGVAAAGDQVELPGDAPVRALDRVFANWDGSAAPSPTAGGGGPRPPPPPPS